MDCSLIIKDNKKARFLSEYKCWICERIPAKESSVREFRPVKRRLAMVRSGTDDFGEHPHLVYCNISSWNTNGI